MTGGVVIDISKCEVGIDEIKLRNKVRHYLRGKMPYNQWS